MHPMYLTDAAGGTQMVAADMRYFRKGVELRADEAGTGLINPWGSSAGSLEPVAASQEVPLAKDNVEPFSLGAPLVRSADSQSTSL